MLTLFGALLGFISSAFPDLLRFLQDKRDRAHELAILDRQMKMARLKYNQRLEEIQTQSDSLERLALYQHAKPTNVRWVDALAGSVRPMITYAFFSLYAALKMAQAYASFIQGNAWSETLLGLWSPEDEALFAAVMSFWFGQRALLKRSK